MADLHIAFRKCVASVTAAILCVFSAHANDGTYDPSFGSVGRSWFVVSSPGDEYGNKLVRLPGGNLFFGGNCSAVLSCAFWLTSAGIPATGYGKSSPGFAQFGDYLGFPSDGTFFQDASAFPDGRVVVSIHRRSGGTDYIALLKANGNGFDPSVGNGAGYITAVSGSALVRATSQNQLIVVGNTPGSSPATVSVSRYDATFHLDTTLGSGGSTTIGFPGGSFNAAAVTLQRDGKIVVIGSVGDNFPRSLAIVRFTSGGTPDPAFGFNSDGRYQNTFGFANGATGTDIVEDKHGRLVFTGIGYTNVGHQDSQWLVDRVLGGGAVDPDFNGGQPQKFTIFSSSMEYGPQTCCVALQDDQRIVVSGWSDREPDHSHSYFSIARFTENGAFDSTFGIGGQSYGDMSTQGANSPADRPKTMVISNGGIIVGGTTYLSSETGFAAAKARIDLIFASDFD